MVLDFVAGLVIITLLASCLYALGAGVASLLLQEQDDFSWRSWLWPIGLPFGLIGLCVEKAPRLFSRTIPGAINLWKGRLKSWLPGPARELARLTEFNENFVKEHCAEIVRELQRVQQTSGKLKSLLAKGNLLVPDGTSDYHTWIMETLGERFELVNARERELLAELAVIREQSAELQRHIALMEFDHQAAAALKESGIEYPKTRRNALADALKLRQQLSSRIHDLQRGTLMAMQAPLAVVGSQIANAQEQESELFDRELTERMKYERTHAEITRSAERQ